MIMFGFFSGTYIFFLFQLSEQINPLNLTSSFRELYMCVCVSARKRATSDTNKNTFI